MDFPSGDAFQISETEGDALYIYADYCNIKGILEKTKPLVLIFAIWP